jgi:hypothetical protein
MIAYAGIAALLVPAVGATSLGELCGTTVTSNTVIVKSDETILGDCYIAVDEGVKLRIEKSEIAVAGDFQIEGEETGGISIKNSTLEVIKNLKVGAWSGDLRVKKSDLIAGGDLLMGNSGDTPVFKLERTTLIAGGELRLSRDWGLLFADDNDFSANRIVLFNDSGDIDIYDNVFVATSSIQVGSAAWTRLLTAVDNSMTVTDGPLFLAPWGKALVLDNNFWVNGDLTMRGWNETLVIDNYFEVDGTIKITAEGSGGICQTSGNTGDPVACE